MPHEPHNRPCAAAGLTAYRYLGAFGFVMIGAKDDADALREAARSLSTGPAVIERLQVWNGACYTNITEHKK